MYYINVIQKDDIYEVSFKYDAHIVFLIRSVPGRRYLPDKKIWTIPVDKLGFLINTFKGTPYEKAIHIVSEEDINVNESLDYDIVIPDTDISNVKLYVRNGCSLYQHQKDFLKYAIDRQNKGNMSGMILADEPGLGKTLSVLNLALYNKEKYHFKRCLVICCVNPAKFHWKRDVYDHTNGEYEPYILGTRIAKRSGQENYSSSSKEKLEDLTTLKMYGDKDGKDLPYFIVTNIESLRMSEGKKHPITDAIIDLVRRGELSMIVLDEVHKNMSPSSIQGKQIDRIKKQTGSKVEWIPMTGTPIVNKPTDVYLPLRLVDGHSYTSFWKWSQDFCLYGGFGGKEIVGYKNIPKLKKCLQNNMIRRKKDDVLDLPPKVFKTEYVENTSYQKKLYDDVRNGLIANKDEIVSSLNPLSQFTRLRQVNECPEVIDENLKIDSKYLSKNAKVSRLLDILEDIHDRGEKVIVFSNWVKPLQTVYALIHDKYGTCCFTGTMSEESREKHKQKFIHDPNYTVMLGTIGALGTMHTFTVARNAIFLDLPWTMADFEQACDRIHRIGTKDSVNIYKLITKDTIDERMDDILYEKEGISNYIVDNIDIRNNPKLFDILLGASSV